ncbi:phosphatidylinositol-specific phospholipase C domain-containing protein [Flocculibacter collagenilyticus]|uniref:phosphatidylinositol-specific phospholipase C domain-containing protein n=1 Tax=Flocculibacter collagenilyticus TaxID=2744479 RepID=UPI0018F5C728|nr:phosphatidylinositol-specific phospholipase C domain-containing protein [Flocculibacter collagenilyticus]
MIKITKIAVATMFASVGLASIGISNQAHAGSVNDFKNSWEGKALALQRLVDLDAPIADNNIPGTHNSYNSEVYRSCNFSVGCRYLDPQQKYSIHDQLRLGARFIEIDVHWTTKMESLFSYPKRLLMCHGVCSINDKYFTEGLNEVRDWLNSSDSENQVLILYVEDHMSGRHDKAYDQINDKIGQWIYRSNGCGAIPSTLTKAQVLAQGKKVILWGDGGCVNNTNWKTTAFTGLGEIGRIWEDRTTVGGIADVFTGGSADLINASDVTRFFKEGANIVNLDDMSPNDGRLAAGIWSWDNQEPNNAGDQDCAVQWGNGRWDDQQCGYTYLHACENASSGAWSISPQTGTWNEGEQMCQMLGNNWHFSVPTNSRDNQSLKAEKDAAGHSTVWLNHTDQQQEGTWH